MATPLVWPATSRACVAFPHLGLPLFPGIALPDHTICMCPLEVLHIAVLLLHGTRFRLRARLPLWWLPFQLCLLAPQPSL